MADSPSELEPPPPAYEQAQNEFDVKLAAAVERSLAVTPRAPNVERASEQQNRALGDAKVSDLDEFEVWDDKVFEEKERKLRNVATRDQAEDGGYIVAGDTLRQGRLEDVGESKRSLSSFTDKKTHDESSSISSLDAVTLMAALPVVSTEKDSALWHASVADVYLQPGPSASARTRTRRLPAIPGPRTMQASSKERPSWYTDAGLDSIAAGTNVSEATRPALRNEKERPNWLDDAGLASSADSTRFESAASLSISAFLPSLAPGGSRPLSRSRPPMSPSSASTSPTLSQAPISLPTLEEDADPDDEAPPAFTPIAPTLPGPSISPPPPTVAFSANGPSSRPIRHSASEPLQPLSAPPQQANFPGPSHAPSIHQRHSMPAYEPTNMKRVHRGVISYNTHISLDPQVAYESVPAVSGFGVPRPVSMVGGSVDAAALYSPAVAAFMQPSMPAQFNQSHANSPSPRPEGSTPSPFNRPSSSAQSRSPPPSTTSSHSPSVPAPGTQISYDASLAESLGHLAHTIQRSHAERLYEPDTHFRRGPVTYYPPFDPQNTLHAQLPSHAVPQYMYQPPPHQSPPQNQPGNWPQSQPLPRGAAPAQAPSTGTYPSQSMGAGPPSVQQGMQGAAGRSQWEPPWRPGNT